MCTYIVHIVCNVFDMFIGNNMCNMCKVFYGVIIVLIENNMCNMFKDFCDVE